jgi:hypothetical protein
MGVIRAARTAGSETARSATEDNSNGTDTKIAGSRGVTPQSTPASTRAKLNDAVVPMAIPTMGEARQAGSQPAIIPTEGEREDGCGRHDGRGPDRADSKTQIVHAASESSLSLRRSA